MEPANPTPIAPRPVQPVVLFYATETARLRPIPLWLILLLIPAVVGCCLQFALDRSPLSVAWYVLWHPAEAIHDQFRILALLAYGLWMCAPIALLCTLRGRFPRACRATIPACLALAGVGIILNGWVLVAIVHDIGWRDLSNRSFETAITALFGLLLVSGCTLVLRGLMRRRSMEALAMKMLLTAYVPITVLCLCVFWDSPRGAGYFVILFSQPVYWFLAAVAFRS